MTRPAAGSLVLSLFPGIDLLGRGFEEEGFCVVRGPDLLWGGDIRRFIPSSSVFGGIIGGSPCQDFSKLRRCAPSGYGAEMLAEFARVTELAGPDWFLLENVPGVPSIAVEGYTVQRLNLSAAECGGRQMRLRCFQFGYVTGGRKRPLVIARGPVTAGVSPAAVASEGRRKGRRSWAEFCALQGLPEDFDLPGMSKSARYQAVGNGVPLCMGRVVAAAIRAWSVSDGWHRVCVCDCGRPVPPGRTLATAGCRKRMERRRKRDPAPVTGRGADTPCLV